MTKPNSPPPRIETATEAAGASASTCSERCTIPSLIAQRTSSHEPLCAHASTTAAPSRSETHSRRWATWRRRRRSPVGGLRGNGVLSEQGREHAAACEQLRDRPCLHHHAVLEHGDAI